MAEKLFEGVDLNAAGLKYIEQLDKLASLEIAVGFGADSGEYADGTRVVDVAAYNEFGTSNAPARPFMRQAWDKNQQNLTAACGAAVSGLLNGGTVERGMDAAAAYGAALIRQEVISGDFVPNAPSTIRRKGSSTPLIDTRRMHQSVRYKIRQKGGGK